MDKFNVKIKLSILTIFFLFQSSLYSQNFDWLKTFSNKYQNLTLTGISARSDGGAVLLINSFADYKSIKPDTLKFGLFKFLPIDRFNNNSYLVLLDSNGKVADAHYLGNFFTSNICQDNNGNIYVGGNLNDTNCKIGTNTLDKRKGILWFAKYDKKLKFQLSAQTGGKTAQLTGLYLSVGNIYFIVNATDTSTFGSKTYILGKGANYIFGKLNSNSYQIN